MLRYFYRLALPGGRRVVVAYYPPKPPKEQDLRKVSEVQLPKYDRIFAQGGIFTPLSQPPVSKRGKRTQ